MCQFLCCDCWWFNCCGILCAGVHTAICICSCWICRPEDLEVIDPGCCKMCLCDGWGGNSCCWGSVCCASGAVREWSRMRSSGGSGGDVVVVVQSGYWQIHDRSYHMLNQKRILWSVVSNQMKLWPCCCKDSMQDNLKMIDGIYWNHQHFGLRVGTLKKGYRLQKCSFWDVLPVF